MTRHRGTGAVEITSGGLTYSYDFENHLIQQGGATFVYDGDGNRVAKVAGGVTTKYLVSEVNPTGYPQVLEEVITTPATREAVERAERGSGPSCRWPWQ